ncbi:hypothetical protein [Microvirga calopogonii]|uniref:hypothetical protein n=1 Tax=Microvirga calopogonii TaxID=2078013 RepID=UPI000E0DE287|nr:hypothetical protein [Microvirga calopogonii]
MPFHNLSSVQITPSADGFVTVRTTAFQIRVHISEKASVQAFLDSQLAKQEGVYILETRRAVIGHQPLVYVGVTGSIARRGNDYQLSSPQSEVDRIIAFTVHEDILTGNEAGCFECILRDGVEASGRAVLANRNRPHNAPLRPAERYAVEALARDAEHVLRALGIDYLDVEKALAPPDLALVDDTDAGSQLYGTSALGVEAVIRRKGSKWFVMQGSTVRAHVVGSVSRTPADIREALLQSGALRLTDDPEIYRLEVPYEVESATAAMLFVTGSSLSPQHWYPVGAPRTRGRRKPDPITRYPKGLTPRE